MSLFDRTVGRAARFIDDVLLLPDDLREDLERAEALVEQNPVAAERLFRDVLEARPGLVRALAGWSRALAKSGDIQGARLALAEARQAEPDEPQLALLAARYALEERDAGAAVMAAREASRRLVEEGGPAFAEACALRAHAEWMRGRPDRAAREFRKALAAKPEDVSLRVALVRVLVDADEREAALRAARMISEDALSDSEREELGVALFRAGAAERARPLLSRAAREGRRSALAALTKDALERGELVIAEECARMFVARGGGAEALVALADVLIARGQQRDAASALVSASAASGGAEHLLMRAAETVPLDDEAALHEVASALEQSHPGSDVARVLRAHAALEAGKLDWVPSLLGAPPHEAPRAALAAARRALLEKQPAEALEALEAIDRAERRSNVDDLTISQLRRDALRMHWMREGDVDLAAAIDRVAALAETRNLSTTLAGARALRDELDRPLLLAILGEFNAGKSTFVNAFVGAEVAPMGILPTTATLNVLRGGAEKRVRVVRKDGGTREGAWEELRAILADARSEAGVDHIEIVLPSELLDRVWVLDTPGSNAPDPEHEALATEALRRADAALWLFDAGQAGKASEGAILEAIRASRRAVFTAINKVDRLTAEQQAQVARSLQEELPTLGPPVMLSARKALRAKLEGDATALEASGFPRLVEQLEREVFDRSRELKRRACAGRLLALLGDALITEQEEERAASARAAGLVLAGEKVQGAHAACEAALEHAVRDMEAATERSFSEAAQEVLSFVRPRTHRFATHGVDPEDRAFLVDVIEQRIAEASAQAAIHLTEAAKEILGRALSGTDFEHQLEARIAAAVGPPFAAFRGYQSGLLEGGALRRFWEEVLPTATLSAQPIAAALAEGRAHPREHLKPSLEEAVSKLLRDVGRELIATSQREKAEAARMRRITYEPLRVLRDVLRELVDEGGAAKDASRTA